LGKDEEMNAYELADELKRCIDDGSTDLVCVCGAVNMIRQQADRIVELEKEVKELTFKQESLCKIIRMRLNDVPRSQYPPS